MPPEGNFKISYGKISAHDVHGTGWWQGAGDRNVVFLQKNIKAHLPCSINLCGHASATSFTIFPSLPSGLSLDPRIGSISGVPLASSERRQYAVTCQLDDGAREEITLQLSVREPTPEFSVKFEAEEVLTLLLGRHMKVLQLLVR
jgi:hypothetical protein